MMNMSELTSARDVCILTIAKLTYPFVGVGIALDAYGSFCYPPADANSSIFLLPIFGFAAFLLLKTRSNPSDVAFPSDTNVRSFA